MTHESLEMYVVYENPRDYEGFFVVRLWRMHAPGRGPAYSAPDPGPPHLVCRDYGEVREKLEPAGLFRLPRFPGDDPVIREVWL